jgi:hypothetical protein
MSEQETTQPGTPAVGHESCLCREVLDQVRECFGVSPDVREHFTNSRIEFLKGIRAIIDSRIDRLSKASAHGTKIAVE